MKRALAGAAIAALFATVAHASFIPVSAPGLVGEVDHAKIMQGWYSPATPWAATGVRTDGAGNPIDFSNGALIATRLSDTGFGGVLDAWAANIASADDQLWTAPQIEVTAVARYASYEQEFGYSLNGGAFTSLLAVNGSGMAVTGDGNLALAPGDTLSWIRTGPQGGTWSSVVADNADGFDHMVSYQVTGLGDGWKRYLLFWEDLRNGGDRDFNDLVGEIAVVPEPASLLLVALGGLALRWRRA